MSDAEWFTADKPRTHDEARFLALLRALALDWTIAGLLPGATGSLTLLVPLVVMVDRPALAGERGLTSLQVGYWPPTAEGLRLVGEWGDDHLLDNGGDETDLRIEGISREPEFFADAAGAWLSAQLLRPIERMEWLNGDKVLATRIRLGEGGQTRVRPPSFSRTTPQPPPPR